MTVTKYFTLIGVPSTKRIARRRPWAYPAIAFLVRLVRTMPLGIRKTNRGREPPRRDGEAVAVSRSLDAGSPTERSLAFVEGLPELGDT
jgi:hypothetical protein